MRFVQLLAAQHTYRYRLWNLDVFRYQLEDTKGIYGTIPYLMAHSGSKTVGMLWNNAGDTTVGIDVCYFCIVFRLFGRCFL